MRPGRRRLAFVMACVAACHACVGPARGADDAAAKTAASGTAATGQAAGPLPYWQAPALPTAVIQGGAIPPGWQPQAVPYQGIGPDGRPLTMYFAPTYVFTYQSGPPVIATPPVNRRPPPAGPTYAPYGAYGWNYQAQGANAVPVALPPATVSRYQPAPYQFPPDARALTGTPLAPPATPLPGPPPMQPAMQPPPLQQPFQPPPFQPAPLQQPYGVAPPQQLAPPPPQWVPSNASPPPGMSPQGG